ncbi:MAG: Holliday junction resolvase RuvX [Firmicutes bacterium]|nr:Holliday junction resolvase RuvX [Bacillota bacterium]
MRILSLDVGEKNIGVAVSDELGIIAQGLGVIRWQSRRQVFSVLTGYLKEYGVQEIVIGLPRNMDGSIGPQAEKILAFKEKLAKFVNIPVVTYDERLTTAAAKRTLLEADVSRRGRKKVIDKLAAVFILEGYLRYRKRHQADELERNGQGEGSK